MATVPPGYVDLSPGDRVSFWTGELYRQMRWAGEDGHDEITIFDRAMLDELRRDVPDFDAMMPSILTTLARMWLEPPAAFVDRVNARLGTAYPVDAAIAAAKFTL